MAKCRASTPGHCSYFSASPWASIILLRCLFRDCHLMIRGRLIDLSHTVEHGLITYKGLPAPIICDYLNREQSREHYAPGTEFQIGKIEMVANTGTYLDSPFHRYEDGKDLSELELASLADLDGVVVRTKSKGRKVKSQKQLIRQFLMALM